MSSIGEKIDAFQPEQSGGGLLGNGVNEVEVYEKGILLKRKKGDESYLFSEIEKILARNYVSPTPSLIPIEIHVAEQKPIKFGLHPDLTKAKILLGAFSAWQLGEAFPDNLDSLDLELGGLGTSIRIKDGHFVVGQNKFPFSDMESAENSGNGFINIKLRGAKHKLGVSPDYAPNMFTTLRVLNAIADRNAMEL